MKGYLSSYQFGYMYIVLIPCRLNAVNRDIYSCTLHFPRFFYLSKDDKDQHLNYSAVRRKEKKQCVYIHICFP